MRFACVNAIAPGDSFAQQCATIAQTGCAGVEAIVFPNTDLAAWQQEVRTACANTGLTLVSVVLGGLALHQPGQRVYVQRAMIAIRELGAAVLFTPEYASQNPLPLWPPFPQPSPDEQRCVDAQMRDMSELARQLNVRMFIEPITQFESRCCRDVATAVAMCEGLNNPLVQVALDTHNMNITEADIAASIRHAGAHIGHVHLSDSNRRMPGLGHLNFAEVLAALHQVSYAGWLSFECAATDAFGPCVRKTIQRLRELNQEIQR